MKIGITTFGGDGGRSGIGQYIVHLLREFTAQRNGDTYEVFVHESEEEQFSLNSKFTVAHRFGKSLQQPVLNVAWHQVSLPGWCRKQRYDALFLPAGNRRLPVSVPCPTIGTVHDFSSLHVKGKYDAARMFYITRVLPFLIRRLNRVITVSESSKEDIVHYTGIPDERVEVIPNAVDHSRYFPRSREAVQDTCARYGIRQPYIIYVSRIEHPGKNHVRLIHAFERLKESLRIPHQLVLVGVDRERAGEVHAVAQASPWKSDIIFTGFFPEQDLPELYCGADALAFPSLYEGFGLPVLEAMACGVPVACSNLSSLPEVAGDAAVLFEPYEEEAIVQALYEVLLDEDLRKRCIRAGLARSKKYNWTRTAERTLEVIRATGGEIA